MGASHLGGPKQSCPDGSGLAGREPYRRARISFSCDCDGQVDDTAAGISALECVVEETIGIDELTSVLTSAALGAGTTVSAPTITRDAELGAELVEGERAPSEDAGAVRTEGRPLDARDGSTHEDARVRVGARSARSALLPAVVGRQVAARALALPRLRGRATARATGDGDGAGRAARFHVKCLARNNASGLLPGSAAAQ